MPKRRGEGSLLSSSKKKWVGVWVRPKRDPRVRLREDGFSRSGSMSPDAGMFATHIGPQVSPVVKSEGSGGNARVQILTGPLATCVTLGELLNFSEPANENKKDSAS